MGFITRNNKTIRCNNRTMMKSRGFSFAEVSFSKKANEDISSLETGPRYP